MITEPTVAQTTILRARREFDSHAGVAQTRGMDHFADSLIEAIGRKGTPICVGIDPMYEMLPDALAGDRERRDARHTKKVLDAYHDFITGVLKVVAPLVPVVKFQSAYFEEHHHEGVELYFSLIHEAKELGLLVIGDCKRGDIGSTSVAYAAGHLDSFPMPDLDEYATPDALTINPMLGMDAIEPFVAAARASGKGLFVLTRTSNPGSRDFQDVTLADGRSWSEMLADTLSVRAADAKLMGNSGYSLLGAVVGATQTHTMDSIRRRMPRSIFLLPGYGAQGATAAMTRAAFRDGGGAIVSASRSLLYPPGDDWKDAILNAVQVMRQELEGVLA